MKTDFNSIKEDLRKLTDLNYLKSELRKISVEIKNMDIHVKLAPQAKERLKHLEMRFVDLRTRMTDLQKQIDTEVNKFIDVLRQTKADTEKHLRKVAFGSPTKRAKAKKKGSSTGRKKSRATT